MDATSGEGKARIKAPGKPVNLNSSRRPQVSVHPKLQLQQSSKFAEKTSSALSSPSPPHLSPHNWVQRVLNREEASVGYEMNQSTGKQQRKLLYF